MLNCKEEHVRAVASVLASMGDIMKVCSGSEILENRAKEGISKLIQETLREINKNASRLRRAESLSASGISDDLGQTISEFNSTNVPTIEILRKFIASLNGGKVPYDDMDMDAIRDYFQKNLTESELNEKLRAFLQGTAM